MSRVSADTTCAHNLLLQLNFEDGFKDVSCHGSNVVKHGSGVTRIDNDGNMVACFDGSSFLEVTFDVIGDYMHCIHLRSR